VLARDGGPGLGGGGGGKETEGCGERVEEMEGGNSLALVKGGRQERKEGWEGGIS